MPQWPKGISGNPAGGRRGPRTLPSLRKLAIPYRADAVAGLLALAKTAEDERVRLAAWIEIAARDALRQLERQTHSSTGAPKNAPTHALAEALEYLVSRSSSDAAPGTLRMYATKGGHGLRLLGDRDTNTLQLDDVQEYINARLAEGAEPETVRKELSVLRKALTLAHARNLMRADPRLCFPDFRAHSKTRDRYLTEAEFGSLLSALSPSRQLWVTMAVYTGTRFSELEALRWEEHIALESRWIQIPGTKTAEAWRKVPIAEPLAEVLSRHWQPTGPVVAPWCNVRRDLAVACKAARIRPVTPNDLRRTFASWLKQAGVDSMVVAKLLGHTTSRMVELVYAHLHDPSKIEAVGTLPAMPETGSKWVTKQGQFLRQERQMRQPSPEESQELPVPRGGIEPPTRGFSVLKSPEPTTRDGSGAAVRCVCSSRAASGPRRGRILWGIEELRRAEVEHIQEGVRVRISAGERGQVEKHLHETSDGRRMVHLVRDVPRPRIRRYHYRR